MSTATDELITAYLAELEREAARLPWNARAELLEDVRSHIEVALAEIRADAPSPDPSADVLAATDETSQVRAMLAALGEPSEIVAAALTDNPEQPDQRPGHPTHQAYPAPDLGAGGPTAYRPPTRTSPPYPLDTADIGAVALLLLGGFLAGIGWVIGAVLLWTSARWTRTEKLIGTLILPGGIAGGLFAFTAAESGTRGECTTADHCVTIHDGWNPPGWLAAVTIAVILLAPAATAVFLVNRARLRPGLAPASRMGLAIIAGVGTVGLVAAAGLLVATSTSSGHSGSSPTPVPADYSGGPASGYAVPVSSPAQMSSGASMP